MESRPLGHRSGTLSIDIPCHGDGPTSRDRRGGSRSVVLRTNSSGQPTEAALGRDVQDEGLAWPTDDLPVWRVRCEQQPLHYIHWSGATTRTAVRPSKSFTFHVTIASAAWRSASRASTASPNVMRRARY